MKRRSRRSRRPANRLTPMSFFRFSLAEAAPPSCRGGVVTIGNFDGVHLGHQALVAESKRQAKALGGPAVAVTFDPHPLKLLRPEAFQPLLTTIDHRAEWLHKSGADHVVALATSPALLALSAREFFERIVVADLDARSLVEGFNFFFGKGREGDLDTLRQFAHEAGRKLTVMPPVALDGRPVSSSRVRDELLAGRAEAATKLLGRPYRIAGVVATGQRRGQTLGFPTANLHGVETIIPGNGVYVVQVWLGGLAHPAAANVGPNPTFGEQER